MKNIEVIRPAGFDEEITAFFTLKNEYYRTSAFAKSSVEKKRSKISGLNLGYNTNESAEIITANRSKLFQQFGIEANNVVFANQIHSSGVAFVNEGGTIEHTDALITQTPGLALAIQVADCAAVLIHEPETQTIAAIHAGWRGAASGIMLKTLKEMERKGAVLASAKAYISPCICLNNFEVGQEVAEQFPATYVDFTRFKKPHINLKGFLKNELKKGGLREANIEINEGCTFENEVAFYSYRREKELSGRMLAVIQVR